MDLFLKHVMDGLGFPDKFIRLIMECVSTINYPVVVNGEPTKPFDATKGWEFLFVVAMEYFSICLRGHTS